MDNKIDKALKDSIISDEALNIAKDYSEIVLDSILKNEMLKEVPIIGTLISLGKIAYSLKDRHTFKKLSIFLSKLSEIPIKDREKFVSKMEDEDQYNESTSEKILLLLKRLDETAKAEILGNLFKLYILEIINKYQFLRFASIVERAYINDLFELSTRSYYNNERKDSIYDRNKEKPGLLALGLFDQKITKKALSEKNEIELTLKLNYLGQALANLMFYNLNDIEFIKYTIELKETNSTFNRGAF